MVPSPSPSPSHGPEPLGPLLTRLRSARGWSQAQLADRLCAAAGVATLSRHEVSRWERQVRVPGRFWLGWLAVVLAVPRHRLAGAATASRADGVRRRSGPGSRLPRRVTPPVVRGRRRRPASVVA